MLNLYHSTGYSIQQNPDGTTNLTINVKHEGADCEWHYDTIEIKVTQRLSHLLVANQIAGIAISTYFSTITVSILMVQHSLVLAYDEFADNIIDWSYD